MAPLSASLTDRPSFLAECIRLPDFAKRYGVSLPTIYNWLDPEHPSNARRSRLPSMKLGREHLVHVPTGDAWVRAKLTLP